MLLVCLEVVSPQCIKLVKLVGNREKKQFGDLKRRRETGDREILGLKGAVGGFIAASASDLGDGFKRVSCADSYRATRRAIGSDGRCMVEDKGGYHDICCASESGRWRWSGRQRAATAFNEAPAMQEKTRQATVSGRLSRERVPPSISITTGREGLLLPYPSASDLSFGYGSFMHVHAPRTTASQCMERTCLHVLGGGGERPGRTQTACAHNCLVVVANLVPCFGNTDGCGPRTFVRGKAWQLSRRLAVAPTRLRPARGQAFRYLDSRHTRIPSSGARRRIAARRVCGGAHAASPGSYPARKRA